MNGKWVEPIETTDRADRERPVHLHYHEARPRRRFNERVVLAVCVVMIGSWPILAIIGSSSTVTKVEALIWSGLTYGFVALILAVVVLVRGEARDSHRLDDQNGRPRRRGPW